MKIIALLICFFAIPSYALVNLDKPLTVSSYDFVFTSGADEKASYLIPVALVVQDNVKTIEIDGEYRSQFQVGYDMNRYNALLAKNPGLRMLRATVSTLNYKDLIDIPGKFRPKLVPLGDLGDLSGSMPYRLSIRKIGPKQGKESQKALNNVFKAPSSRFLGLIEYEFNAIKEGKPAFGKSAVGIFASVNPGDVVIEPMQFGTSSFSIMGQDEIMGPIGAKPVISLDKNTGCWTRPQIGEICVK